MKLFSLYKCTKTLLLFLISAILFSCNKYLEQKPTENLVVPSSLEDLQAILDNQLANDNSPHQLELVADNFFMLTPAWGNLNEDYRKAYIWAKDAKVTLENGGSWLNPYTAVQRSNFVLEQLQEIKSDESEIKKRNNIEGTALFYRAFMFYQLAQLYCKPFSSSASSDPGIVLRTVSNVIDKISRSTVDETYQLIIKDLNTAVELLPSKALFTTRPNKAAAKGMLARVYLSMRDYNNAGARADEALQLNDTLIDYNQLSPAGALPSNAFDNPEILFLAKNASRVFNAARNALIDTTLFNSFSDKDLRRTVFFTKKAGTNYMAWKGSYYSNGLTYSVFTGLATDELYLIRAEVKARAGKVNEAMNDLNRLLKKRWVTNEFTDLVANSPEEALNMVLTERRKELLFRGLRWTDLRRLNLENANIALTRNIDNNIYTLPPNDPRWVLLIPEQEITRSGIPQNPR